MARSVVACEGYGNLINRIKWKHKMKADHALFFNILLFLDVNFAKINASETVLGGGFYIKISLRLYVSHQNGFVHVILF